MNECYEINEVRIDETKHIDVNDPQTIIKEIAEHLMLMEADPFYTPPAWIRNLLKNI